MFQGQELNEAMGIPFFYGMCEAFFVGLYCFIGWKAGWTKAPPDVPFWKMIFTTYEVLATEEKHGEAKAIEVSHSISHDGREHEEGHIFTTFFTLDDTPRNSPKEPSGKLDKAFVESPQSKDPNLPLV
jgi:hypothetical protein